MAVYIVKDSVGNIINTIEADDSFARLYSAETGYTVELAETPIVDFTPAEQRQLAYETDPVVSYPDDTTLITVDEANKKWLDYEAEGNTDEAGKIQGLIATAKASIREKYPD